MKRLCIVILNYRRAQLTIDCLRSVEPEIAPHDDRRAVIVDNNSGDGSADVIDAAIREHGWDRWITFVRNPANVGFAAGNNLGFRAVDAEFYLLLNSDARLLPGSVDALLEAAACHDGAGMIGPRLQGLDGQPQISCFRFRTPISEMLWAAGTGALGALFKPWVVAIGVFDQPMEPPWLSFACVLIRRDVIDQVGPMDEHYFMYFEDIDYSRRARNAGWRIVHDPAARAVHLRGGTSSVKAAIRNRARVPKYYYEARSRYFAKFYGGVVGLVFTNLLWIVGRSISLARELLRNKKPHTCAREGVDNWTNWLSPLRPPAPPEGGEL